MERKRVFLGKLSDKFNGYSDNLYLYKHEWSCGWYWSKGIVGNSKLNAHFDSLFLSSDKAFDVSDVFSETNLTSKEWWILRDLFVQAYALSKAAEVYRYGGHQTTERGITDMIKNDQRAAEINADLSKILDCIWKLVHDAATR